MLSGTVQAPRIFVAGHRGMVGSAILCNLLRRGHAKSDLITRARSDLELLNRRAVELFFAAEKPDHVYLAAAKVGGIHANNAYPADACVHLMSLPDTEYRPLLAVDRNDGLPPMVNVGVGDDVTIAELAKKIAQTVGFKGRITFDPTKPDGTPRKLMDSSRLHALGWRARTSLMEGLSRAYDDFKARSLS